MNDGTETIRQMRDSAENVVPLHPNDEPPVTEEPPPHHDEPPMPEEDEPARPVQVVTPLGMSGETYFYLDELGQLRALKARDHNRLNLMSLFGRRSSILYDLWPRKTQDKETKAWITTGWKPDEAGEALMRRAAKKGVWTPKDRVRGGGAWRGPNDELILHVGDRLLVAGQQTDNENYVPWQEQNPGEVGRRVYPTGDRTMVPHPEPQVAGDNGPANEALKLFRTWSLRRPGLDEYLLLGWVGAAMLSGALRWRPLLWITGGWGTGKSSLQKAICQMMGDGGILHTSDPTAAGIRQVLKHAAHPIAIDEAEAEEDRRRMDALVKLARDAASGSLAVRGGSDHEAAQFNLWSCFLFGSILIPPLLPQDRSRLAVVEVDQLREGAVAPKITEQNMAELGARLMRRLVDGWPRLDDTIEMFRNTLGKTGHSARGQDVFGTLMGVADVLLNNDLPDTDSLNEWAELLPAASLAETAGEDGDAMACLDWLLTSSIEGPNKGRRDTVGQWIRLASGHVDEVPDSDAAGDAISKNAQKTLGLIGVKIHTFRKDPEQRQYLAVSHQHVGLSKVFDKTQWGTRPGASGVWRQSLGRLCNEIKHESVSTYVGGSNARVTLVPLHLCLPKTEGNE